VNLYSAPLLIICQDAQTSPDLMGQCGQAAGRRLLGHKPTRRRIAVTAHPELGPKADLHALDAGYSARGVSSAGVSRVLQQAWDQRDDPEHDRSGGRTGPPSPATRCPELAHDHGLAIATTRVNGTGIQYSRSADNALTCWLLACGESICALRLGRPALVPSVVGLG
jgi:hypothetical protein